MNTESFSQDGKTSWRQSLREDVSKLLMSREIRDVNVTVSLMLPDDMKGDINVFCFLVLLGVANKAYGQLIIGKQGRRVNLGVTEFVKKMTLPE
jgi:hypothetical protein